MPPASAIGIAAAISLKQGSFKIGEKQEQLHSETFDRAELLMVRVVRIIYNLCLPLEGSLRANLSP